jgi:hypothetical protein
MTDIAHQDDWKASTQIASFASILLTIFGTLVLLMLFLFVTSILLPSARATLTALEIPIYPFLVIFVYFVPLTSATAMYLNTRTRSVHIWWMNGALLWLWLIVTVGILVFCNYFFGGLHPFSAVPPAVKLTSYSLAASGVVLVLVRALLKRKLLQAAFVVLVPAALAGLLTLAARTDLYALAERVRTRAADTRHERGPSTRAGTDDFITYAHTKSVRDIAIHDDTVWLAIDVGVVKNDLDVVNITLFDMGNGLAGMWVTSIAVDPEGRKWFGTDKGVSRFDGGSWTTYRKQDGLIDNWVWSVAVDDAGNLWFGTGQGVSKYTMPQPRTY